MISRLCGQCQYFEVRPPELMTIVLNDLSATNVFFFLELCIILLLLEPLIGKISQLITFLVKKKLKKSSCYTKEMGYFGKTNNINK